MIESFEIRNLAADLAAAGLGVAAKAKGVVTKGALNVKKDARKLISGPPTARAYPFSITYDLEIEGHTIVAEIGPDKSKNQGALGNILEYGTSNNAPLPHLGPALEHEAPNFERFMGDIGSKKIL